MDPDIASVVVWHQLKKPMLSLIKVYVQFKTLEDNSFTR